MAVTRIPVTSTQRRKNQLGRSAVPCQVSQRWLDVRPRSAFVGDGEFITIEVRTDIAGTPRTLCSIIVTREDLERALSQVQPE